MMPILTEASFWLPLLYLPKVPFCSLIHLSLIYLISLNLCSTILFSCFFHPSHWHLSYADNTVSIVSRRREVFSQDRDQDFFSLVVVVADGGEPPLSSTTTLSLRVCVCQRNTRGRNSNNICQAQAFLSSTGLSTGAFVAILLCIIILLGK